MTASRRQRPLCSRPWGAPTGASLVRGATGSLWATPSSALPNDPVVHLPAWERIRGPKAVGVYRAQQLASVNLNIMEIKHTLREKRAKDLKNPQPKIWRWPLRIRNSSTSLKITQIKSSLRQHRHLPGHTHQRPLESTTRRRGELPVETQNGARAPCRGFTNHQERCQAPAWPPTPSPGIRPDDAPVTEQSPREHWAQHCLGSPRVTGDLTAFAGDGTACVTATNGSVWRSSEQHQKGPRN